MARPLHSDELKARAITLAVDHGPAEAHRILTSEGITINPATIRSWCSRAGVATVATARTAEATAAAKERWEQRRAGMADDCGRIAQKALDHMERAIDAGDMADARMLVAPFGVLVDKAQLLSGGATSRTESLTAEHAHALIDEVAARRAKAS